MICLVSKVSNEDKVNFFFALFNFNNKGYLLESEVVLMLMTITRAVYKIDRTYHPPSVNVINRLAKEALKNCSKIDKSFLRRPELIQFVILTNDGIKYSLLCYDVHVIVIAFLETFRGHSSEVLLQVYNNWKDLSFACSEQSITPVKEWLKYGMVPGNFVRWRRREKVGKSGIGCLYLFTHNTSFFKTIDRKLFYNGEGVIGKGYLRQGLLADRWFLNALAVMIANPKTISDCFIPTNQENKGRYCVKLYEGSGWRSIYIGRSIVITKIILILFR